MIRPVLDEYCLAGMIHAEDMCVSVAVSSRPVSQTFEYTVSLPAFIVCFESLYMEGLTLRALPTKWFHPVDVLKV